MIDCTINRLRNNITKNSKTLNIFLLQKQQIATKQHTVTGASTLCTFPSSTNISRARKHNAFTSFSRKYSHRFNRSICESNEEDDTPLLMLVLFVMLLAAAVVVLVGVAEVMLVFDIDDDDDALEGCDG